MRSFSSVCLGTWLSTTVGAMSDLASMLMPLEGTFPGWPVAETPTPAQSLLVLVAIPVVIGAIIGLLVFAGHLARRGSDAQMRLEEPLWVGGQTGEIGSSGATQELTTGQDEVEETGGASVRW